MNTESAPTGWAAVHGGIFLATLGAVALWQPPLAWPWYLLVPLAVYTAMILSLPPLRRTAPRFSVGRLTGAPLWAAVALSVVTSLVLLAYHVLAHPDVTALAAGLSVAAFGSVALAGVCFSVANAALEELIFRGVLYEVVAAERGAAVAIGVTAVLFGLGHLHGYPPGWPGAVLAGGYGVALGLLRWWAGGLGLAVAAHVGADATIFALLAWTGAFSTAAV